MLQLPQNNAPRNEWNAHIQEAKTVLSQGRVVVILGATDTEPRYEWDEDTLCDIACVQPDGSPLEWHCKHLYSSDSRQHLTIL
jgi:hypothetical protein